MRVLVAGSRMFCAGYRIDRALVRASAKQDSMTIVSVGRFRSGAESIAKNMAEDFGWATERVRNVSEAQADICAAFLHRDDPKDDKARIIVMKAEKAGIPIWRYYEGGPRQPHPEPGAPLFTQDMVESVVVSEDDIDWDALYETTYRIVTS